MDSVNRFIAKLLKLFAILCVWLSIVFGFAVAYLELKGYEVPWFLSLWRFAVFVLVAWKASGPLSNFLTWLFYCRCKAILLIYENSKIPGEAWAIAQHLNLPLVSIRQQDQTEAEWSLPLPPEKLKIRKMRHRWLPDKCILVACRDDGLVSFEPQSIVHHFDGVWICQPRGVSHEREFDLADPTLFDQINDWLDDYLEHPWHKLKRHAAQTAADE